VEKWRPVVGYEDSYEISSCGRVRSIARTIAFVRNGTPVSYHREGDLLRPGVGSHGYKTVSLKGRTHCVHDLVLSAFVGQKPAGLLCRHIDGDRSNCNLTNIEWATRSVNGQDIKWHRVGKARKLTVDQVRNIKKLLPNNYIIELSRQFGVSRTTIRAIRDGATHADV
jgi:hypothetical protein